LSRKIKRGRLRSNLKTLAPKPGIILLQEHKIPEADCIKLGALGVHKGQILWNGGSYNAHKDKWKAGTPIIVSSAISHLVLDSGIVVPSRAQWITYSMDNQVIGMLNIYAPNKSHERATFWTQIANNLPLADSWLVGGDFNIVEREGDHSTNTPKKLSNEEREAWDQLVMRLGLEDVWNSDDFTHYNSYYSHGVINRKVQPTIKPDWIDST
jgi:hypothetical protein